MVDRVALKVEYWEPDPLEIAPEAGGPDHIGNREDAAILEHWLPTLAAYYAGHALYPSL